MGSIWVAVVRVSPAVRAKLSARHGLDADEVITAIQCVRGLQYGWDDHPDRGQRVLISARRVKMGEDWGVAIEAGDFYEDDEPIEDVLAAWERSPKGLTGPTRRGFNMVLQIGAGVRGAPVSRTVMVGSLSLRPDRPMVATG